MLEVFNTLSKRKEQVKPRKGKKLNMFVCGPTVYDFSHLGHARTYIAFDAFVRFLRTHGYKVDYLQNITDIDDKIIRRAQESKITPLALARKFEREYLKDMKALGIQSVNKYAKATEHIPEIISQVKRLLEKGYAYVIEKDGIYYDILRFKRYGRLSGRTSLGAEDAVSRIDESVKKRNKGDFALWKFSKKGEPKWKSPWGEGRPGWHIEDTAMTEKRFGPHYDLHGGARDLIFPHHEAEIAQMEAISGKSPMAKYWMHSGFLTVESEKMAKSLGNFITIRDFLKEHSPRALRLFVLKAYWRSPIDYSKDLVLQAEKELERIDGFLETIQAFPATNTGEHVKIQNAQASFLSALEDDFNTPKAIAALFEVLREGNRLMKSETISAKDIKNILSFLKKADEVFGFIFSGTKKTAVPSAVQKLAEERERYRKEKQWQKADELRMKLSAKGWQVDDTPQGPRLKKLA